MRDIHTRNDFGPALNELGLVYLGVIVGVKRGEFADMLLKTWYGTRLMLVADSANVDDMNACAERIVRHKGRFVVWHMAESEAAERWCNESFDFIYLDNEHPALVAWYPKVKPGGVFAGKLHTNALVFAKLNDIEAQTTTDSFYWQKPELECVGAIPSTEPPEKPTRARRR